MSKVYLIPQKTFKFLGIMALVFGVVSCASSQSTSASSGETDGIYYSPSKDGQIVDAQSNAQDYDIKVGSPYFDANGNGAEDFYYEESQADSKTNSNVNIYTGGSNVYVNSSATTDWGRYDGLDITVNNYGGWYNPWWGWGYSSWNWSWSIGWGGYYGYYNPYWWGGYHYPYYGGYYGYYGYPRYYGYPYYGYYGGYYGYYGYPSYWGGHYYNRGTAVRPGTRPGSSFSHIGTPNRQVGAPFRDTNTGNVRPTRTGINSGNVRGDNLSTGGTRPVRNVRTSDNNTIGNSGTTNNGNVRNTGNVRTGSTSTGTNNSGNVGGTRPVRSQAPSGVRPNTPSNNQGSTPSIRTNSNNQNTTSPRVNTGSGIRSGSSNNSAPRSSAPSMRSSTPSSSMGSGTRSSGGSMRSSGGGVRSSGGSRR